MYYAGFGLLSLILHLIINQEVLKKSGREDAPLSPVRYRQFLLSLTVYEEDPVIAFGIAEYRPGEDLSVTGIFERADDMMYADKRGLKQQAV